MGGFTSMEVVGKILSKAESRKPKAESPNSAGGFAGQAKGESH